MPDTDVSCAHMFNGPPGQARCQHTPPTASSDPAHLHPLPRTSKPHARMHTQQSTSSWANPTVPAFSKYPRSRWVLLRFTRRRVHAHLQGTPRPYLPASHTLLIHTYSQRHGSSCSLPGQHTPNCAQVCPLPVDTASSVYTPMEMHL